MDLRQFVSSTITQVMEGITDAQPRARELGGYVNPSLEGVDSSDRTETRIGWTCSGQRVFAVTFDVAVTAGSATGGEGGGKLEVASVFSFGAKASTSDNQESVSRVKFVVPIALPLDKQSVLEAAQDRNNRLNPNRAGGQPF